VIAYQVVPQVSTQIAKSCQLESLCTGLQRYD
jgi:hypothetical protein